MMVKWKYMTWLMVPWSQPYQDTKVGYYQLILLLIISISHLVQLMARWKFGTELPNSVSIPLTTMLIKFGVWHTIMMVQNLCLFQKTKVYICIAYLFDQNRNISKVQNPTFFFQFTKEVSSHRSFFCVGACLLIFLESFLVWVESRKIWIGHFPPKVLDEGP